jgi:hypothetical protein
MIEILAALSAGAAAGLRLGTPLLIIGLLQGTNLWSQVPLLSRISPYILLAFLTSWSLFELFASKRLRGQRIIQLSQVFLSPIVGAIMGLAVASTAELPRWIIILIGGLLALVLQLVQLGWFYRLGGLPMWMVLVQDALCVTLVIFAVDAPQEGGLIALILLWFAIHSAKQWYQWYWENRHTGQ